MATISSEELFVQSTVQAAKHFWQQLEDALATVNRPLQKERILDLGCNFPELFIYPFHLQPEKIKSYWGVEQGENGQLGEGLDIPKLNTVYKAYQFYVRRFLVQEPFDENHFNNTFHFSWNTKVEDFCAQGLKTKFSFLCLRNILHFIEPKHDDVIIHFLKNHLDKNGIIYIEAHKVGSSIQHGRPYPFDVDRCEKYTNMFRVISEPANPDLLRLFLIS